MILFTKFAIPFLLVAAAALGFNVDKKHGFPLLGTGSATTTTQAEVQSQISARDTSDASLEADVKLLDLQLQALDKSSVSVDRSFGDKADKFND